MDSGVELKNDSTTDDGSSNFLWLAASLIGGTLFFMLLAILFIVIWKCYRKQNTNNWAGPSPLTEVTVPADMMFKEEVTTLPAKSAMYYGSPVTFENSEFLNEDYDTTNEQPEKNVEGKQSHIEKNNKGKAVITIPLPMTCENNVLSLNELSNQPAEKLASEDSNLPLPPPPDYVLDCPMAPPEMNFYASPSDVHCKDDIIQCEINLENYTTAQMEDLYTSRPNQDNDLPPPPPPPEFL